MSKTASLPERLYVVMEDDGDEPPSYFPVSHEDVSAFDNGSTVGVYVLQTTQTLVETKVLV